MDTPTMIGSRSVAADTTSLVSYFPIPFYGILPVNAFLLRAAQPVLVDTGLSALRDPFMNHLRSTIDLKDLRWLWLTHTDADHMGNLLPILAEAPNVRVVTTFLGMGKMMLQQLPLDRVYLLNPGQELDVGDRKLLCVKPPSFDAPETTGFIDTRTRVFFSADCFGALMKEPAETAADIAPDDLREGVVTWTTIDAPWLEMADKGQWNPVAPKGPQPRTERHPEQPSAPRRGHHRDAAETPCRRPVPQLRLRARTRRPWRA